MLFYISCKETGSEILTQTVYSRSDITSSEKMEN